MFYKPKYCCNCGEKIERIGQGLWENSRFCDSCKNDLKYYEWLPLLGSGSILVISVIFFGVSLQQEKIKPDIKPNQLVETKSNVRSANKLQSVAVNQQTSNTAQSNSANSSERMVSQIENQSLPTTLVTKPQKASSENQSKVDAEPTYFCGAATKKATACSRRVKGGGRCWQHEGQAAVLPQEKLLVAR